MEEMTRRELAFCYIYSQEIQKQNSKAQVKIFLDSLEIENNRDREYVKDSAQAIKEHNEEISKLIEENLKQRKKSADWPCVCRAPGVKNGDNKYMKKY